MAAKLVRLETQIRRKASLAKYVTELVGDVEESRPGTWIRGIEGQCQLKVLRWQAVPDAAAPRIAVEAGCTRHVPRKSARKA